MIQRIYRSIVTVSPLRISGKGEGSTKYVKILRDRYLASPLMIDVEYIKNYAKIHKELASKEHYLTLRAECHSYALENLTPVIREGELIVGSKTRYVRGAIPYCNYASQHITREMDKKQQDEQHKIIEVGKGGGIDISHKLAASGKYKRFGGKFIVDSNDYDALRETASYFLDKCFQSVGDSIWKANFPNHEYIEKGWRSVLFTAPLDSAPDGRFILDFETALGKGLRQIIDETKDRIRNFEVTTSASSEKVFFWRACIRVLEATIRWSNRYANQAEKLAESEKSPKRKQELMDIAERLRRVPEYSPRNFSEAIQAWWILYLAGHIEGSYMGYSPGRFDRYMFPYFEMDKNLNANDALELLEQIRVKMTEIEYVASHSWEGLGSGNLFQNMIIGGERRDGKSAENELSMLILQSAINCKTIQPTLSIWYSNQLSQEFLMKAIEVVKTGVGFPAFFNLNVYLQHELARIKNKVSLADIREYAAMGGCTEPVLEGMSHGITVSGFINQGKLFELALFGGVDPQTGEVFRKTPIPHSVQELKDRYLEHLEESMKNWQVYWNYAMPAHKRIVGLPYASSLTKDCLNRGLSLDDGGAINNGTPTTLCSGMVNVVNSFASVEHLLETKQCTMDELRTALKNNWGGYEKLHKAAIDAPKWGNDDDRVDKYFVELFEKYCTLAARQTNYLGEKYDPTMLAISTHGIYNILYCKFF